MDYNTRDKINGKVSGLIAQYQYLEEERKAKALRYRLTIGGIVVVGLMILCAFNL